MTCRPSGSNPRKGFTLIELLVVVVLIGLLALIGVRGLFSTDPSARETLQKVFAEGRQEAVDVGSVLVLRLDADGVLGLYKPDEKGPYERFVAPENTAWRLDPGEFYFFTDGAVTPGKIYADRKGRAPETFWIAVTGQIVPQN